MIYFIFCVKGGKTLKNLSIYVFTIYWVADIAFVDRADIKAYVGPPTLQARYEILRSCLQELIRTGILSNFEVRVLPSSDTIFVKALISYLLH